MKVTGSKGAVDIAPHSKLFDKFIYFRRIMQRALLSGRSRKNTLLRHLFRLFRQVREAHSNDISLFVPVADLYDRVRQFFDLKAFFVKIHPDEVEKPFLVFLAFDEEIGFPGGYRSFLLKKDTGRELILASKLRIRQLHDFFQNRNRRFLRFFTRR